jgi:NADH:ubiquinone oxidoreductase subunit E
MVRHRTFFVFSMPFMICADISIDNSFRLSRTRKELPRPMAGVLSYYPSLNTRPAGRHRIQVCLGESCFANRCDRVVAAIQSKLGIDPGQTTPDGRFTLEPVSCVGNCAVSPSVRIDGELQGRVRPGDVAGLLERYR